MTTSSPHKPTVLNHSERIDGLRRCVDDNTGAQQFLVDFDYTLFLSNSTEEFLNCARPASLLALVLKILGAIAPWRVLIGGTQVWRDVFRVGLIILLSPWILISFRHRAAELFERSLNTQLDSILANISPQNIVIVSFGFEFIVRAFIGNSRYAESKLIAPSFFSMAKYRHRGKLAMLKDHGLHIDEDSDVVITDSAEGDADLLAAVKNSFHIIWPEQITKHAFHDAYIPFYYTAYVKRDPQFFIKQVVLEELPIVLFAFGILAPVINLSVVLSLVFLFAAMIMVYEIGYAENDRIGYLTEEDPKLTDAFFEHQNYKLQPQAWIAALLTTVVGLSLLDTTATHELANRLSLSPDEYWRILATASALWMAAIFVCRSIFWIFNHVPILSRLYVYLPLHASKYFAPLILLSCNSVGYALISAHIVRTWSLYAIRRAGGDIELVSSQLTRLVFLLMFIPIFSYALAHDDVWVSWTTWLVIGWCVIRSVPEVRRKLFSNAGNGN